MREIQLTKGQVALVSDQDYHHLNEWTWHAQYAPKRGCYLACRWECIGGGKKIRIYMHRYIKGLKQGNKLQVDHKDHNPLNNQRSNLRVVTCQMNSYNRRPHGVCNSIGITKRGKRYRVILQISGVKHYLGLYDTVEQAAAARQEGFERLFGRLPTR